MSESYCPFCGSVIKTNDEFCGNCGASINAPATPSAPPAFSQPSQPYQQPGQQPYSSVQPGQQYGASTQPVYVQPSAGAPVQQNKAADKSLVFALIGLFIIPFIGGLFAVIFGIQGVSNPYNRNKAIIGIVLGIIEMAGYGILAFFRFF